jgi:hypothetical protein
LYHTACQQSAATHQTHLRKLFVYALVTTSRDMAQEKQNPRSTPSDNVARLPQKVFWSCWCFGALFYSWWRREDSPWHSELHLAPEPLQFLRWLVSQNSALVILKQNA